jgi:ATP-dependent DNA ligase I
VLLAEIAEASQSVAATSSRTAKLDLLAGVLRSAPEHEVRAVASYLSGELLQRRTGVGSTALRDLPPPAPEPSLHVADVDAALDALSRLTGAGSATERRRLVADLLAAATAPEQQLLRALIGGELRQGAAAGLVVDAVSRAADVPLALVRRALTLHGSLPDVARSTLRDGAAGLAAYRLEVGRALAPMLAATAADLDAALERCTAAAIDWKVDGVRVQVHVDGDEVHLFTRTLDDVTDRLPAVVALARGLPVRTAVLDGEAVALRADGRPERFQVTASRSAREQLTVWFFDVLHLDGEDLLEAPLRERAAALARIVPAHLRVPTLVVADAQDAREFAASALAAGHEGVVVKDLDAPYDAGRRGGAWRKVKPRHTLDLVVLAAEWGHGRRRGWLSNLHLGARSDDGFVMLGKTFKGLTDELLRWQTERLLALAVSRDEGTVRVRPELVVEVAFDGVQSSTRYPGGVTLRFARVLRYRDDKPAGDADSLEQVQTLLPR